VYACDFLGDFRFRLIGRLPSSANIVYNGIRVTSDVLKAKTICGAMKIDSAS
jgi:hypothetical protein